MRLERRSILPDCGPFVPVLVALALCIAPAAAEHPAFRLLRLDGVRVKWGHPVLGSGAAVTYGFATDHASFPEAINCQELAPMATLATGPAIERAAAEAFAMWSRAADVEFRPAAPGAAPDILIGAQASPEGIAYTDVRHGAPARGVAPLTRATICLNPTLAWTIGNGPVPEGGFDLSTVFAHEIGHAIGLDHPGAAGALMGYSNQGSMDELMSGDVAGARAIYGPPRDN